MKYWIILVLPMLLLINNTSIASPCPDIPRFSLSEVDQDFARCTYSSSTISGAAQNPDLCLQAFEKAIAPYNKKESCDYDSQNNACVCKIGHDSYSQ